MRDIVHAITPGDHFSPRTGSAIPTVIDGLARAAAHPGEGLGQGSRQRVLVAAGTYPQRYASVEAAEYPQQRAPSRAERLADLVSGRLGNSRRFQQRELAAMLSNQGEWSPSWVLAHNLVQLLPLVDSTRHRPVLYAHNDLFRTYSRAEAAQVTRNAALIICVSEFLAERIRAVLPQQLHDRVVVVPNAADSQQFTPAGDDDAAESLRVVFLGRVVPDKGPDVLLRAAAELNDPRLQITVVGSAGFDPQARLTGYERKLREIASRTEVPVSFRPFTDRHALPELLRAHDMLVVPSRWPEPWGLTVSEGQAAGLVVLASNAGGIPEAISDSRHLVPPGDVGALAGALGEFLTDRQLLARRQAAARTHAEAHDWHYSWRRLAAHLADVG